LGFQGGQFDFALLRLVLGMESGKPAFEFTWKFLLDRYQNSFEKLSEAWQVKITSKEDIRQLNKDKTPIPGKAFDDDAMAFVMLYANRYFEITNKTIKRYDPNHLILGCRFGGPPPTYVLDAIKPWTDVISANNYQPFLYERFDTLYNYTGLPLLIGEFRWNTDLYKKVPFPVEAIEPLTVKDRMFRRGVATLSRTAMHDGIVGYTWYRWVQGTSTAEKFFDGIVNYGDTLEMHCAELQKLNPTLEKIRLDAANHSWKNTTVSDGEMTLLFEKLRPEWNQYLRISFIDAKPVVTFYGWKMTGKVLKYSTKQNTINMKIEVDFEDVSNVNKNFGAGKGFYELKIIRAGETFNGVFTGIYNNKAISGSVKAFYFPN